MRERRPRRADRPRRGATRSLQLVSDERLDDREARALLAPRRPRRRCRRPRGGRPRCAARARSDTSSPPCSSAFWSSSVKTSASARRPVARERDRLDARLDVLAGAEALDDHPPQPLDELAEVDVVLAALGQHLVDSRDREDPVDRVLERPPRVDVGRAGLQAEHRGDGLEVVLHAVVDLLGEHAAHDRAAVLERDRRVVSDRGEQRPLLVRERARRGRRRARRSGGPSSEAAAARRASPARPSGQTIRPSSRTIAAPVAPTAPTVVSTIAASDSSR